MYTTRLCSLQKSDTTSYFQVATYYTYIVRPATLDASAFVSIRQHTPAYVAYVSRSWKQRPISKLENITHMTLDILYAHITHITHISYISFIILNTFIIYITHATHIACISKFEAMVYSYY